MNSRLFGWLDGVPGWEISVYIILVALAVLTRFWDLGTRAMHHDESIHAFFALDFLGSYEHNPLTHGPFQFFGINLFFNIFGESEVTARGLAAVSGVLVVGLPFFLRNYLGRWTCMLASLMLLLSPTVLYFTRFARNDAYMAVWTLLLIVFLWKFSASRKVRYLYAAAGALSLAFATKENTFILMVILVGFFFLLWVKGIGDLSTPDEQTPHGRPKMAVPEVLHKAAGSVKAVTEWLWPRIAPYPLVFTVFAAWIVAAIFWSLDIYDVFGRVNPTFSLVSLGVALGLYLVVVPWLIMLRKSRFHPRLEYQRLTDRIPLIERLRRTPWPLLVLLPLPLMGAALAVFQEPFGLTLANPNSFGGAGEHHVPGIPDGAPAGNVSLAIALGVTVYLFAASFYLGIKWDRKKFLIASAIFWSIFLVLFTTFFTNTAQGLGSGLWQSLGYWVAQQEVRRGAQPWYYYLLMTTAYEFLALALVIVGAAWLVLKKKTGWKPSPFIYQGVVLGDSRRPRPLHLLDALGPRRPTRHRHRPAVRGSLRLVNLLVRLRQDFPAKQAPGCQRGRAPSSGHQLANSKNNRGHRSRNNREFRCGQRTVKRRSPLRGPLGNNLQVPDPREPIRRLPDLLARCHSCPLLIRRRENALAHGTHRLALSPAGSKIPGAGQ